MEYKVLWKTGIKKKRGKRKKEKEKKGGGVQHGCAREELIKQREGNVTWFVFGREEKGGWTVDVSPLPTVIIPFQPGANPGLPHLRERERAYDFYPALF